MVDHETLLDALGDRTRRAILEQLRSGPRPVVDIARELPVGRPAVSQHLKVLKAAGLVSQVVAAAETVLVGFTDDVLADLTAPIPTGDDS